jgi:hypothetical protein
MTQLTRGGRTTVIRLNWGRQGKDLTQFQQLILIVITKKGADWGRYKRRYYYSSLCSRMCEISLYFSNLNSFCSSCGTRIDASAQPHSHDHPGGLISPRTPVSAPWLELKLDDLRTCGNLRPLENFSTR